MMLHQRGFALVSHLVLFFGMHSLFLFNGKLLAHALRSTRALRTFRTEYPELETAMSDTRWVDNTIGRITQESKELRSFVDNDKRILLTDYYLPVFKFVDTLLQRHRTVDNKRPLFIGISAPQGCGKTTTTSVMCDLFRLEGKSCVAMSLDDFYLTGQQQDQLAKAYPKNELLRYRGNAGTHDLHLAMTTLHSFSNLQSGQTAQIPRYDKALRDGRGDRLPRESWATVTGPVDVVLLEGWMLGFNPLPQVPLPDYVNRSDPNATHSVEADGTVAQQPAPVLSETELAAETMRRAEFEVAYNKANSIKQINEQLRPYEAIHLFMDAWLVLAVASPSVVHKWRLQAEQRMRADGRGGLTDDQVADFVNRFMPAYETYLPELYARGPQRGGLRPELAQPAASDSVSGGASGKLAPVLKITVGEDRMPLEAGLL